MSQKNIIKFNIESIVSFKEFETFLYKLIEKNENVSENFKIFFIIDPRFNQEEKVKELLMLCLMNEIEAEIE